jgi:hypothetical protein
MVTQIDNLGAVDYSDMGIVSQLEDAGTQLYDETTVKGIANTKRMRKRHAYWEKIKMDPKKSKEYNAFNEQWDNRFDAEYIKGESGAAYKGADTPTLYAGNPFELLTKTLKNLPKHIVTTIDKSTGTAYYFNKKTEKYLSEEQILSEAQGMLGSNVLQQLEIDAWGTMNGMSTESVMKMYNTNYEFDVKGVKAMIADTDSKIASATGEEKDYYATRKLNLEKQLAELNNNYDPKETEKYLNDPDKRDRVLTNLYTRNIFEKAVTSYSAKEIKQELILNREQIARDNETVAKIRAEASKKGGENPQDPLNLNPNTQLLELGSNTAVSKSEKLNTLSFKTIKEYKEKVETDVDGLLKTFLKTNAYRFQGSSDYLGMKERNYLDKIVEIAKLDGNSNLDVKDIRKALESKMLSGVSQQYFQSVVNMFDAASKGEKSKLENTEFSQSDFLEMHTKINMLQESVDARDVLVDRAMENLNLSDEETKMVRDYASLYENTPGFIDNKYRVVSTRSAYYSSGTSRSFEFTELGEKVDGLYKKYKKQIHSEFEKSEYIQNWYEKFINDEAFSKRDDVRALIKSKAARQIGESFNRIDLDTIKVVSIRQLDESERDSKKTGLSNATHALTAQVKKGTDDTPNITVYFDDKQAAQFGMYANPYYQLDQILLLKKETRPVFWQAKDATGDYGSKTFQFYLRRESKDSPIQVIVHTDDDKVIKLGSYMYNGQKRNFDNAVQAMEYMQGLINLSPSAYKTRNTFFEVLRNNQSL